MVNAVARADLSAQILDKAIELDVPLEPRFAYPLNLSFSMTTPSGVGVIMPFDFRSGRPEPRLLAVDARATVRQDLPQKYQILNP